LRHRVIGHSRLIIAAFFLELHVAEMEHGADNAQRGLDVVLLHVQNVHRLQRLVKCVGIGQPGDIDLTVRKELVRVYRLDKQLVAILETGAIKQLVEDVECAFIWRLSHHSRFLKQIGFNVGTGNVSGVIEIDSNKFAKTRRVVVLHRFRIAKRFQQRIRLEQLVLELAMGGLGAAG